MNNEEKILELLTKQGEMLEEHSEMLEKQGEMLEKHSVILEKLTEKVDKLESTQAEQGAALGRLEEKVERLQEKVDEVDKRSFRTAVLLEGEIAPKVQLLFEGQQNLRDTLAPKDRMEVFEERVITLETVIKSMSKRLTALEQAK